jgi:hypothetical protein
MHRRLRLAAILLGVGMLAWLPFEDTSVRPALVFAALTCSLAGSALVSRLNLSGRRAWIIAFTGAAAGLAVTPLASGLMLFKSGLHAHTSPDFSLDQYFAVLQRTSFWIGAGFLVGLGFGLLRRFLYR